jgi:hypothetical protein
MAERKASNAIMDLISGNKRSSPARETSSLPGIDTAKSASPASSKTPAVAPAKGGEVAMIEEKQESLLERVLSRKAAPEEAEARDELSALHGVLTGLSQKTVIVVFALGKILAEVKAELPHGEFIPWIEKNCQFTKMSASNYMRVYERYKDEPRRALAELSISEAYVEAGVKKLAAPEKDDADEIRAKGEADLGAGMPKASEYRRIFEQVTMSGVELKHYRVFPHTDGSLYAVRPETGPIKVCDLFVDMSIQDLGYQDAIQEVHHNVQMALEVFYSKMEACETRGIINAPFDSSRPAMARKMRNVTPEGTRSKKPAQKKAGKGKKK